MLNHDLQNWTSEKMQDNTPEIAYIMKEYPRLSETFIMNEIHLLKQMDLNITVFSVKQPPEKAKQHKSDNRLQPEIVYLPPVTSLSGSSLVGWLWTNLPKFFQCHFRLFKQRPTQYLDAWFDALMMTFRYRSSVFQKPKKAFIKEFLQAGFIAEKILVSGEYRHLHGHFCHGSTTITMFVSQLSGLPYSFTAHAKDIYLPKLNPGDLLKRKIEMSQFVVTCTGANKTHLASLSPKNNAIHTIYHGLDISFFKSGREGRDSEAIPLILSVGRFVEKKGFDYLVKACRILKDQGQVFQCRIVGEPDDQSGLVKQLIQDLKLEETVFISGGITQAELRQVYRECTFFVLPCQIVSNGDRDGIPNVLVEAMAMGIPVISTAISGIPELIETGKEGFLVRQRDDIALADAMATYLGNADLRAEFARAGRWKVCHSFDSKKTNIALRDLFISSIEGKH